MSYTVDISWKSLNKYKEELCGDKVEVLDTEDSRILILADGMGSGVKANILATLTSRILGEMLREGARLADCVETVARTLPVCQERKVAYATFTILQIHRDGNVFLAEYENPACMFIRKGKLERIPFRERIIGEKKIREAQFPAMPDDCFVVVSDGVIYAGAGSLLNYGWTWEAASEYALKCAGESLAASRLASRLADACSDLYEQRPGDDTTVAVARVRKAQFVNILTGPPADSRKDSDMVHTFMEQEGKKIIAGGATAEMAARILGRKIRTETSSLNRKIPPASVMEGADLITEGALTLSAVRKLLQKYEQGEFDTDFFRELDQPLASSRLARILLEECTHLQLYVGTAVNTAHENQDLPFEISTRKILVLQLQELMEKMGRSVRIFYY